jgi:ABC-type multidrug transport system ATPase subunit
MTPHTPNDQPHSLPSRASQVKDLVAAAQLEDAIRRLLDLAREFDRSLEDAAIMLSRRYHQNRRDVGSGLQTNCVEENRITKEVLDLVNSIAKAGSHRDTPPRPTPDLRTPDAAGVVVASARGLTKLRRARDPYFKLAGVDLYLRLGEITAVIGPNGQGKTTLLEIMAGRLQRDDGSLSYPYLCGANIDWPVVKAGLAYVTNPVEVPAATEAEAAPPPAGNKKTAASGSVERVLRFVAATYGATGDKKNESEVDRILERLRLTPHRKTAFSELSSGYKARVALAAALLKEPKLLIIDEPLANLDKRAQPQFLEDVRNLSRSETEPFAALLSSQHIYEIESIADKVLFLSDGSPRYYGPVADIRAERQTEAFELQCDKTVSELRVMLPPEYRLEKAGPAVIVHTPRGVSPERLVSALAACQVVIRSVRNIGESTRMFFQEDADGRGP